MSIGRSPRASCRRVSIALMSSGPLTCWSKGMSTATSLNSHCAVPGEGRTASAPSTMVVSSAGLAGLQMRVATRDMQADSPDCWARPCLSQGRPPAASRPWRSSLAQKTGGVVINTDSMQVYRDLRIITARPTPDEEALVPHRLYGHVDASVNFSAGAWVSGCGEGARRRRVPQDACRSSSAAPACISRR